jgi:hypothetical protein
MTPLLSLLRVMWAAPNSLVGVLVAWPVLWFGGAVRTVGGVLEVALFEGAVPAGSRWHRAPFVAITLGHVVLGISAPHLDRLRAHEHAHVRQYERLGPFFVLAYLAAGALAMARGRRPYHDNHFEIEACREADASARVLSVAAHGESSPSR